MSVPARRIAASAPAPTQSSASPSWPSSAPAWRWIAGSARGRGVGRTLLNGLADACEAAGLHKLTSRVFTSNAASRALHRACGFDEVGVVRRHAKLDGEWRDCVLVERLLGEAAR